MKSKFLLYIAMVLLLSCGKPTDVAESSSSSVGNPMVIGVVSYNGIALDSVGVFIISTDSTLNEESAPTTITDSTGAFSVELPKSGTYRFSVLDNASHSGTILDATIDTESQEQNLSATALVKVTSSDSTAITVPATPYIGSSELYLPLGVIPAITEYSTSGYGDTLVQDLEISDTATLTISANFSARTVTTTTPFATPPFSAAGNDKGVAAIDSYNLYTTSNGIEWSSTSINSPAEVIRGDSLFVIRTAYNLSFYDGSETKYITSSLPVDPVDALGITTRGNSAIFAIDTFLVIADSGSSEWNTVPLPSEIRTTPVTVVRALENNSFYVGTHSGSIWQVSSDGLTATILNIPELQQNVSRIVHIYPVSADILIIANQTTIVYWSISGQNTIASIDSVGDITTVVQENQNSHCWIQSDSGIYAVTESGARKTGFEFSAPGIIAYAGRGVLYFMNQNELVEITRF